MGSSLDLRSSFTHAGYLDAVARVREYILAGDIFQTNLSQRFEAPLSESPWDLYLPLRDAQRRAVCGVPRFARRVGPQRVARAVPPRRTTRGASRRGRSRARARAASARSTTPRSGQALTESAKDRAENLMIVDLMRNDLSRVCAPGHACASPSCSRWSATPPCTTSSRPSSASWRPAHDALDLLRAAFPGGSITGAPKVRAMEIIAELEPSQRGVYCGSIGYWSVTGALDTSIAIRTVLAPARRGRVYFNAGGGIVADSDPEQEYRETLDKARGIIDAPERARS